jgi:hypothetical protein
VFKDKAFERESSQPWQSSTPRRRRAYPVVAQTGFAEYSTLLVRKQSYCPAFASVLVVLAQKLCQNEVVKFLANE